MKTPSSLAILFLAAALPTGAAAEPKPGERCDTAFLEKVSDAFSQGNFVKDAARIEEKDESGTVLLNLKFGEAKTCDASAWRYLGSGTPRKWRSDASGKYWDAGRAGQQSALVLAADDFYRAFDARALKVIAAADAVIDAAVQLDLVTTADTAKTLSELLPGRSGGPIGAMKPKAITFVEASKQSAKIPQESVGAVLRKLTDEGGTADGIGTAVLDFRMAVLELNAELGRLGGSRDLIIARTSKFAAPAAPAVNDYTGLPENYPVADPKKPAALDKVKFKSALDALIGAGETPALDAAAPRAGAALDDADLGARNLIAARSEQVAKIVAAARARLQGKTITAVEVAGRAAEQGKGASSLGAATLKALAGTKEYIKLDELYEAAKERKGLQDPETIALAKARDDLKESALSTKVEVGADGQKSVAFTANGRTHVLPAIVPPQEGTAGDARRENAAALVASFIVDEAHSRKVFETVNAVLKDPSLDPNGNFPSGITNEELPVSKEVPPAVAKINAEGAGCKDPRDMYRNNFESYAARKQQAAAEIATGNSRTRDQIQATQVKEIAASKVECEKRKAAALALQVDSYTPKTELAARRAQMKAEAEAFCTADIREIDDRAAKALTAQQDLEKGDRDPNKNIPQANKELDAAAQVAITGSVSQLRRDYTNPAGGPKVTKLMQEAGLKATRPDLVAQDIRKTAAFSLMWFKTYWPEGEELVGVGQAQVDRRKQLDESIKTCKAALGITPITVRDPNVKGSKDSKVSYGSPDDPSVVSRKCNIHADLTAYIKTQKPKD